MSGRDVNMLALTQSIHTSSSTDGYLDYGDQHKDFNEDGCKQDHSANPTGDEHTISCTFACA
jgi:hypothetical protein